MVEDHIQPQYLKAHVVSKVLGLTRPIMVRKDRLPRDDGLDDHVLNFGPELLRVVPHLLDRLHGGGQRPLMPLSHILIGLVVDELVVALVNSIVG